MIPSTKVVYVVMKEFEIEHAMGPGTNCCLQGKANFTLFFPWSNRLVEEI